MNEDKDYQGQKIDPKTWRTILSFAAGRGKYFILILGGGMLAGMIDTAMSFMSRWAIDGFMTPGTTEHLWLFASAALGLQLLMAALTLLYCRAAGRLEANLNADVREAAYSRLQTMSYSYFDKTSTGHLISRLTGDISRIMEMVSWTCIDLGWGVMAVAASLIAMFLVNLKLALITLIAVPLVAVISVWFQKKILGVDEVSFTFQHCRFQGVKQKEKRRPGHGIAFKKTCNILPGCDLVQDSDMAVQTSLERT